MPGHVAIVVTVGVVLQLLVGPGSVVVVVDSTMQSAAVQLGGAPAQGGWTVTV